MPDKTPPVVFNEVVVDVLGKPLTYYMTNSVDLINNKLEELGCRHIESTDYRFNPSLAESVKKKMTELGTCYSMILSKEADYVNYYMPGSWPFIIFLKELYDPFRKEVGDGKSVSVMQHIQDMLSIISGTTVQTTMPPLMSAVLRDDYDAARFQLEAGAAPDDSSKEGFTALMVAVIKNNKELVKLLLEKGANVNAMANNGFTPYICALCMDLADSKDRKDIAEMLKNAGGIIKGLPSSAIQERMSFHDKLNAYISRFTIRGLGKEALIYKRCGMDKRTFSKIRNNKSPNYQPRKNNVFSLIIGMELTLSEAEDLLASAGYAFSRNDTFDEIIRKNIENRNYDIVKIECELFEKTGKYLTYQEKEKRRKSNEKVGN